MIFTGIVGAPLVWLTALQTGYTLAYQACDSESRAWVVVPTVLLLLVSVGTLIVPAVAFRRAQDAPSPRPFLAVTGIALAALMVVSMIASLIAPVLLRPCD